MRKTSQKFNSDAVIQNIWELCGETEHTDEIPYWETINKYLGRLDPKELQDVIFRLVFRLVRSRAFAGARIRNKYWKAIIDGTQIHSSRKNWMRKTFTEYIIKGRSRNMQNITIMCWKQKLHSIQTLL